MQSFNTTTDPFEGLSRKELAVMPEAAASYARAIEISTSQALNILSRMHPDAFYYQPRAEVVVAQPEPAEEPQQFAPVEEQFSEPAPQVNELTMQDAARLAIERAYSEGVA